jgi:hypothetical protein
MLFAFPNLENEVVRPCREEEDEEGEDKEEGEFGFDVHDGMLPPCVRTVKRLVLNVRCSSFAPVAERCFLLQKNTPSPLGSENKLGVTFPLGGAPLSLSLFLILYFLLLSPPPGVCLGGLGPPWGLFVDFGVVFFIFCFCVIMFLFWKGVFCG